LVECRKFYNEIIGCEEGRSSEQATMFFFAPYGNALEFKSFMDVNQLFSS